MRATLWEGTENGCRYYELRYSKLMSVSGFLDLRGGFQSIVMHELLMFCTRRTRRSIYIKKSLSGRENTLNTLRRH